MLLVDYYSQDGILTLSGQTLIAANSGAEASARFRFDDDGNVYESENLGAFVQIDTADDWIRPVGKAPGDYEVRYTGLTGDALASATAAEDVWHPFSSGDFILEQTDNTAAAGGNSSTFTIEIRKGSSGGADVSASYTLTADREDI